MKKSYREGIANRSGPEPCEGGREAGLEALRLPALAKAGQGYP